MRNDTPRRAAESRDQGVQLALKLIETVEIGQVAMPGGAGVIAVGLHELEVAPGSGAGDLDEYAATVVQPRILLQGMKTERRATTEKSGNWACRHAKCLIRQSGSVVSGGWQGEKVTNSGSPACTLR